MSRIVQNSGSLTDIYSVYFWDMVFWMVVIQAAFVGVLIMPLPSNYIRGIILKSIDRIWAASPHVCTCEN